MVLPESFNYPSFLLRYNPRCLGNYSYRTGGEENNDDQDSHPHGPPYSGKIQSVRLFTFMTLHRRPLGIGTLLALCALHTVPLSSAFPKPKGARSSSGKQ